MTKQISVSVGGDGVALWVLDVPGASLNPLSDSFVAELDALVSSLAQRDDIRGVVLTSAKKAFAAGWNLIDLLHVLESTPDLCELNKRTEGFSLDRKYTSSNGAARFRRESGSRRRWCRRYSRRSLMSPAAC